MYLIAGNAEVQAEIVEAPAVIREVLVVKEVLAAKEAPAVKEVPAGKEVRAEVNEALVEVGGARVRGEAIVEPEEAQVGDAALVVVVEVNREGGVDHGTENEVVHQKGEEDQRTRSVVAQEIVDQSRVIGDRNPEIEEVNRGSIKDVKGKVVVEIGKVLYLENGLRRQHWANFHSINDLDRLWQRGVHLH